MIIEDSEDTVDMVTKLLESEKFEVIAFYNGVDALNHLKKMKDDEIPDLIILDMFMPNVNGLDILGYIKKLWLPFLSK